jgi:hypothetical protein
MYGNDVKRRCVQEQSKVTVTSAVSLRVFDGSETYNKNKMKYVRPRQAACRIVVQAR